jgi:hypothetical protein
VDGGQSNDDDTTADPPGTNETPSVVSAFDTVSHSNPTPPNTPPSNTIGDSVLVNDPGLHFGPFPSTVSVQVFAKPGTTLNYFCIFHPQMQGKIKVVG